MVRSDVGRLHATIGPPYRKRAVVPTARRLPRSLVCCVLFWLSSPLVAQDSGICDRTLEVRNAIVAVSEAAGCAQVTQRQLRDVTSLDLSDQGLTSLQTVDFAGLHRLKSLDLSDNLLTLLPGGLFDELFLLETLRLNGNRLTTLPVPIFHQLFLLEELTLHGNQFTSLPDGLFDELSRLDGFQPNGDAPVDAEPLSGLRRFLDRHAVTSVEGFINALPALHRERFVIVYRSEGLAAEAVTEEHPRIIAWGADGRFVFTWLTNPDAPDPFGESIEFLHQTDDKTWIAGVVRFSNPTPEIAQPEICQSCHGSSNKPLWGGFYMWAGTEGSYSEIEANTENNYRVAYSDNPRIAPLDFSATVFFGGYKRYFTESWPAHPYTGPVEEASLVFALRHAEVLFKRLKGREDYDQFVKDTVCSTDAAFAAQASFMETRDHSIGVFGNELRSISVFGSRVIGTTHPEYYYQNAYFGEILVFLILHDLWEKHATIRRLYRRVSNADLWDGGGVARRAQDHLVYPMGEATAEDELIQLYRLHFGHGSRASLDAIGVAQPYYDQGNFTAIFGNGHLWTMLPRVCAALTGPTITNPSTFLVAEGETFVASLTATDPDTVATDLVWSLSGGADRTSFALTADGQLTYLVGKDFEAPDDVDADGIYHVTVQVSDGTSNAAEALAVTLSNINETPTADAGTNQEGVAEGATVTLTGTGTDPDAGDMLTYAWTQTAGTTVTPASTSSASTTFTAPTGLTQDEVLTFRLRVTDAGGLYAEDQVDVTIVSSDPLTAEAGWLSARHDGTTPATLELRFSEEVAISYLTLRDTALEASGGTVVGARRLAPPSNMGWAIAVEPSSNADVTLTLPADRPCNAWGAICTPTGKRLTSRLELTLPGPDTAAELPAPLTASGEALPERHDGSTRFTFLLRFSEDISISYLTLRDTAFEVSGGTVEKAQRMARPTNLLWQITVNPSSDPDVVLVLPADRACDALGAICTAGGKRLSNRLELTVPGPE